jgi:hypothetical protein
MHWIFSNTIFFIFKILTHRDFCHFLQLIFHFTLKSLNFSLHFLTNHMFRDIYKAIYIYLSWILIFMIKIWKLIHNNEELFFYCSYKNNQCITTLWWVLLLFFTLQVEKQGNKIIHFIFLYLIPFSVIFFIDFLKTLSLTSKKIVNLILVLFMIMKVFQF